MAWAIVIMGILLAAALGGAFYLYANRVPEDPYITPRQHYSIDNVARLAGMVATFI